MSGRKGAAASQRSGAGVRWRRALVAAAALPLTAALINPVVAQAAPAPHAPALAAPAQTAPAHTAPVLDGVKVNKVEWITARRVALWVHSPAMNEDIQVQINVGRDWNIDPGKSYPQLVMLDGLRARDDVNGWTLETNIEEFFADKNVNVVLPVGGESSFYTDWNEPDNGHNYQWETFLTKELPPILERDWRSTDVRGIAGLSMGGTAAMMLAQRHPDMYKFVGSYSGILNTTSLGMPQALQFAMLDAGNYHSQNMWGPPSSPRWAEQDPLLHVDKLRGKSIYISSGNGFAGPHDQVGGIPGISTNIAGMGLEILSRLTSQNFASALAREGIPANVIYRPSGTHSWPYWQFELHQSWPQIATALGVSTDPVDCAPNGAIGGLVNGNAWIGNCVTPEYPVTGGVAQDYTHGRVFWSNETGANFVAGLVGGRYQQSGGPGGFLGLPTTSEFPTLNNTGRFNNFQRGAIYWSGPTGAHSVSGAIQRAWGDLGWEQPQGLGFPLGEPITTPNGQGQSQRFERGVLFQKNGADAFEVRGMILDKYKDLGFEGGQLGFPQTNERDAVGGKFNRFDHGNVYWSPASGAWSVMNGPIMDAWRDKGYEGGELGFPVSDQRSEAGAVVQDFQRGQVKVGG